MKCLFDATVVYIICREIQVATCQDRQGPDRDEKRRGDSERAIHIYIHTYRQADIYIYRQTGRQTGQHTSIDTYTYRQAGRQAEQQGNRDQRGKYTYIHIYIYTERRRETERQRDINTYRQRDIYTYIQTDREAEIQKYRETENQRDREI